MNEEMDSILQNDTQDLVKFLEGNKSIDYRWIYKIKFHEDGSIQYYKAHLVAKGFKQIEGVDYKDTFIPITNMTTVKLILALVT